MGQEIKAIYTDVGGVLLTNGWDTAMRKAAAEKFGFDYEQMNKRHGLMYSTHELGKIDLDTYLDFTFFYEKRDFTKEEFKRFMYEQSQPYPEMLGLLKALKDRYNLKIGAISNEGKELMSYRINTWLLDIVDFFCVSGFVGYRKPDPSLFNLAMDVGQIPKEQAVYIDDRVQFAEISSKLGLRGIHHTSYESTKQTLETLLKEGMSSWV